MRTGIANLPLHTGHCPPWLFKRMRSLSSAIAEIIIDEEGPSGFLRKISDPFWFQAFGNVLGFDWHSSGLTTTVCGALKEALKPEMGIAVAGGKGKVSRKAPQEIISKADVLNLRDQEITKLVKASKLSAKVDNCLVQDNYQLYHHLFVFTEKGEWAVIQQGMNPSNKFARRYHWLSEDVENFVEEPHSAICCNKKEQKVLDLTAKKSKEVRKISLDLIRDGELCKYVLVGGQTTLTAFTEKLKVLNLPSHHFVADDFRLNKETLKRAYECQPSSFEELVSLKGVGPKTIRALALISHLIYGAEPSWRDSVKFSFAHGGKDGHPYPVNRKVYDKSVLTLQQAIEQAKLGQKEKLIALKRLKNFYKL